MDGFRKLKHWLDGIVGSSKHVSQLGVLSLERDGTREPVHPAEQWVLCAEEDVLQASALITWGRVNATVNARAIQHVDKLLGVLSSLPKKTPGPNRSCNQC